MIEVTISGDPGARPRHDRSSAATILRQTKGHGMSETLKIILAVVLMACAFGGLLFMMKILAMYVNENFIRHDGFIYRTRENEREGTI